MSGLAPQHCAAVRARRQRRSRTRKDDRAATDGYATPPDPLRGHARARSATLRECCDTPTTPGDTMRRTVSILAAAAVALAGSLAAGGPAAAATPPLRFHGAQYDSPGADTRSTASLNNEWISLVNSGSRAVNLTGY